MMVKRGRSKSAGPPAPAGDVTVALLRGINVGGKNKLPMTALAEIFSEAGCSEVRTYVQSGNVVFRSRHSIARRVPLPDEFRVEGSEIYLRCPNGVARTRLTNAYFDTKLATVSTARSWNTVLMLAKLATAVRQSLR